MVSRETQNGPGSLTITGPFVVCAAQRTCRGANSIRGRA